MMRVGTILIWLCASMASGPGIRNGRTWSDVQTWVYQLTNYRDGQLHEIALAPVDVAVIDLARDGGEEYFSAEEITDVKSSGKFVLAYFEIGAIENYRPEWKSVPADLKAGAVDGWPKEQYVKFWDDRWWPVVKGRIDRAIDAGYDGAYLDLLTCYSEIPLEKLKGKPSREDLAVRMVDFIVKISEYAKKRNPNFKIVPQNCPELATWSHWEPKTNQRYLDAIDGLGLESVFFLAHDKPANKTWCRENRDDAKAVRQAGKAVFGIDYIKKPANLAVSRRKMKEIGFAHYAGHEDLNSVILTEADLKKKK